MTEADEERELRRLLERAVPRLPAPEQRMRQVRRRVLRRRRRRAAGLSATVAAAAVAAVLSWPSTAPAPTREEPVPAASAPTGRPVHYSELLGLGYRLPPGWYAQGPVTRPGDPSPTAFAATQPLSRRPACTEKTAADAPCGPLDALDGGGALVTFGRAPGGESATDTAFRLQAAKSPTPACRKIGGTRELTAARTVLREASPDLGTGEDRAVTVSVCLREPAEASLAQAREMLSTAVFAGASPTGTHAPGR
ncbi:hypothetical protein AB0A77_04650 [Streptomyces varsoviensis]|uniref:hypothetical protein n=1 Tax=Streptomyces varsoviensis TaxID=67373 RepID=UPI0033D12650